MASPELPDLPDEIMDLLVKQVTEGLSPEEARELQALDSETLKRWQLELERAAAALTLAAGGDGAPLPAPLAASIAAQAQRVVHRPETHVAVAGATLSAVPHPAERRSATTRAVAFGWLAAAACAVLALIGWLRTPPELPPKVVTIEKAPPAAPERVSDSARRLALLAQPDTYKVALAATPDAGAGGFESGDVVWDPHTQQGFAHFKGLKANDPKLAQYQLWIFDAERDQKYPVDGGVFDIPAGRDEIVVPIHAAVRVHQPAMFAVTVEQPGGVVVSGREHIVVLGKTG